MWISVRLSARALVTLVAALAVVAASALVAVGADTKAKPAAWTAFDARGRMVGSVVGFQANGAIVHLRVGSVPAVVLVFADHFEAPDQTTYYDALEFESADCTGAPLGSVIGSPSDIAPITVLNGSKIYANVGYGRAVTLASYRAVDGVSCIRFGAPVETVEADLVLLTDLASDFQAPYSIRPTP